MAAPLIKDPKNIRLAMLGATAGNAHPYSWSAMFNGYNKEAMVAECGAAYAGIPAYLGKQPPETVPMEGAKITHIHCEGNGGFTAESVAKASLIPNVVAKATDVIGKVDAVIIGTDIGGEHVARARPFVEAGLPVFVDKPLCDNSADLKTFKDWVAQGKAIMSSSSMRYTKEFMPYRASTHDLGALRYVSICTAKSWETYGIHALEAMYPIVGPGFLSVRNVGTKERNVVHLKHKKGIDIIVIASYDMFGGFGALTLCGTAGQKQLSSGDSFYSFKKQLEEFVQYLRTGVRPFPFEETVELMQLVIGGIRSRNEGGREITLEELTKSSE